MLNSVSTLEKERPYLQHINYFRGIAIIFIVFGHCFNLGISHYYQNQTIFAKFLQNLLPGGTIFFVFISGYLFHHIYYHNFRFSTFFFKKIKYVFVPFLIISSLDIFYYLSRYIIAIISASHKSEMYITKLKSYPYFSTIFVGRGEISPALWYIPFIMVVFVLSPVFLKFLRIKVKLQSVIICILLIISTLIHRTAANSILGVFQNVIYFTPIYLLGIYMSINFKKFYEKLKGREFYILLIAIILAIIQTRNGVVDLTLKNTLKVENFDFMIIQKILLSFFFVLFLKKFVNNKFKILNLFAENSFGIFFMHGIFIWLFNVIIIKLKISFVSNSTLQYFGLSTFILTFSLAITMLIRKTFPNTSKFIIGC
jgi:surface polysaccharide O-acyltransferase-like enzyme